MSPDGHSVMLDPLSGAYYCCYCYHYHDYDDLQLLLLAAAATTTTAAATTTTTAALEPLSPIFSDSNLSSRVRVQGVGSRFQSSGFRV